MDWHISHRWKLNGLHSASATLGWANLSPSNWILEGLWNSGSLKLEPYWQCSLWIHSALWQWVWFTLGMSFEILLSSTETRLTSRFCFAFASTISLSFSTFWIFDFGVRNVASRSGRKLEDFGHMISMNEEIAISKWLNLFSNHGWLWQYKVKHHGIHIG